eukprot:TRINITY_DN77834_c0_g2_i1.p1 TRINITY_DN77834_c0_g2~~TRINITY_DN77834_c0_g2_i1.p1  ORF type:complete len:546 (-),score=35.48 TRINITY_DN77834_c0_g2_i1:146-1783(-)
MSLQNLQIKHSLVNHQLAKQRCGRQICRFTRLYNVRVVCKNSRRTILQDKKDDVLKKKNSGKKLNKREIAILEGQPYVKVQSSVPFAKRITNSLVKARTPRTVKKILDEYEDYLDHITLSCAALTLSKSLYVDIPSTTKAYDTLIEWTEQLFTSFDGKAIASVMFSLARAVKVKQLDKHCPGLRPLYERLLQSALNQITSLTLRDLGQILVSMTYMDWPESKSAKIFLRACKTFQRQNNQSGDILRILTAMNYYKFYNLLDIQHFLDKYGKKYQAEDAAGLMINLLQLHYYDKDVVQTIEQFVLISKGWKPRQYIVCRLVNGFSNFEKALQDRENLIEKLSALFKEDNHRAFPDELLEYMYGMTMLDCTYGLLEDIVVKIINQKQVSEFTEEQLAQLRQIQMVTKVNENQSLPYSTELQSACENALDLWSKQKTLKLSSFKDQVFQTIFEEFRKQSELDIIEQGVLIDIGINSDQHEGNKVAIVLVEREQAMLNDLYMVKNEVKMRKRLYESLGWKVVEVFQRDWDKYESYRGEIIKRIHQNITI